MPDSQNLSEFLQNITSDLAEGRISAQEAVTAATQYAYIREALEKESAGFAESAILGDDAFKEKLQSVLTHITSRLESLASFKALAPDNPRKEEDIKQSALLHAAGVRRIKSLAAQGSLTYKEKRQRFIHDIVAKFSSTMPEGQIPQDTIETNADRALFGAAQSPTETGAIGYFADHMVAAMETSAGTRLPTDVSQRLKNDIQTLTRQHAEYFGAATIITRKERDLLTGVFEHLDTPRPDVFTDVLLNAPSSEARAATMERATKLSAAAHAIDQSVKRPGGPIVTPAMVLGAMTAGQMGTNALLRALSDPARDIFMRQKAQEALGKLLKNSQRLTDRLGENFVQSAFFKNLTQNLSVSLGERPSGQQAKGALNDLISSVFRGPLDAQLQKELQEHMLNYFELHRANALAPKGHTFFHASVSPWTAFLATITPARFAQKNIPAPSGFALPAIGLGTAGMRMGSMAGDLFASGVDRSVSFLFNNPFFGPGMAQRRRAAAVPTPLGEDMPKLVAVVVVVTLLLLFVLPTPLNITYMQQVGKIATLLSSLHTKFETLNENIAATTFHCEWNGPQPPVATINSCPVHGGVITQLPFVAGKSHEQLNAYDFADAGDADFGAPVYAAHDGYIVEYNTNYAPDQFAVASYGNRIVMVATNPSTGNRFCTIYAHLLDVDPVVVAAAGQPILIKAGTQIGLEDNTGYTVGSPGPGIEHPGTHLHFGYKGDNQNTAFPLPPNCP